MKTVSTKELANMLKIRPGAIHSALYNNRFKQPTKDASGDYRWSEKDVETVCKVMTGKSYQQQD